MSSVTGELSGARLCPRCWGSSHDLGKPEANCLHEASRLIREADKQTKSVHHVINRRHSAPRKMSDGVESVRAGDGLL